MTSDSCSSCISTAGTPAGVYRNGLSSRTVAVSASWFTPGFRTTGLFLVGAGGLGRGLAGLFALDGLHHDGRRGIGLHGLDDQMAQHRVVVAEGMLEFVERGLAALDVHADVMGLDELLDWISQLATAPVLEAMHLATLVRDDGLVALDHGGHLLALIGMHDKHYFVVTHVILLVDVFWHNAKRSARWHKPR